MLPQGDTEEEALKNAKESIICYLEGIEKLDKIKSKPQATLKEINLLIREIHRHGN